MIQPKAVDPLPVKKFNLSDKALPCRKEMHRICEGVSKLSKQTTIDISYRVWHWLVTRLLENNFLL